MNDNLYPYPPELGVYPEDNAWNQKYIAAQYRQESLYKGGSVASKISEVMSNPMKSSVFEAVMPSGSTQFVYPSHRTSAGTEVKSKHHSLEDVVVTPLPDRPISFSTLAEAMQTAQETVAALAPEGSGKSSDYSIKEKIVKLRLRSQNEGQEISLMGDTLLGRKPSATSHPGFEAVRLADPTRTISREHALIRFDKNGNATVEDLRSFNGTSVIRNDVEHELGDNAQEKLAAGDVLRLGDELYDVLSSPDDEKETQESKDKSRDADKRSTDKSNVDKSDIDKKY